MSDSAADTIPAELERREILAWLSGLAAPLAPALAGQPGELLDPPSDNGRLSDRIESFARPLLAAAPWFAAGGEEAPWPVAAATAAAARATLLHATNPNDPLYWGPLEDYQQPICEASSVAWCLHNARAALWDPLDRRQQEQLAAWLGQCQERRTVDSNWQLFPVLPLAFLQREGFPVDQRYLERHFLRVFEDFYAGSGWYADGPEAAFDSYNGAMIHPYLLMLDELGLAPDRSERLRSRALEFLDSFLEFFDEEGVAPFWGRSALYRITYLDSLALALRRGLPVRRPGCWRKAVAGAMRHLPLSEITGEDGLLEAGYLGRKENILDHYSCRGSAYWLGRLCHLAQLPPDHPFWREEPETPWEEGVRTFGRLPLAVNRRSRHVVAWNLGITHKAYAAEKYHHLLLSGRFGQVYGGGAAALCWRHEGQWRPVYAWEMAEIGEDWATVRARAGENVLEIEFSRAPDGHNVIRVASLAGGPIRLRLGSFAVSGQVRQIEPGLRGAEGISILRPLEGWEDVHRENEDGVHLWARKFSYPAAEVELEEAGDSARAEVDGLPGLWSEVLELHGAEEE